MEKTKKFANILFSGKCNFRCPYCIGQLTDQYPDNRNIFPLKGMDEFIHLCQEHNITEISLTATNTDPLLYQYLPQLLQTLRNQLPEVRISLHTNGALIGKRQTIVESFDRISLSLYSFRRATFQKLSGIGKIPDYQKILTSLSVPIKISILYSWQNHREIKQILKQCQLLDVKRIVLRNITGFSGPKNPFAHLTTIGYFAGNPVYRLYDMEITWWDFNKSQLSCINLFADGSITNRYWISKS